MILSDADIRAAIAEGRLTVVPLADGAIRPASVDLRLGALLAIADPNEPNGWRDHDLRDRPFRLYQGSFVLAHTLETVALTSPPRSRWRIVNWIRQHVLRRPTGLVGILAGKSSRAREGIQVEAAGYVDPGWYGELTIEATRRRPGYSTLYLGMLICQIRLETVSSPCERPYGWDRSSHYQGSRGPVVSRMEGAV